jgi:hypothetical protein
MALESEKAKAMGAQAARGEEWKGQKRPRRGKEAAAPSATTGKLTGMFLRTENNTYELIAAFLRK